MPAVTEDRPVFVVRPLRLGIFGAFVAMSLVVFYAVGWFALPVEIRVLFSISQRLTLLAVLALLVGVIAGLAASSVRADADGLRIRNGLRTYTVPWGRVHKVIFRSSDPWAQLLLTPADGSAFAVDLDAEKRQLMGIQAVDGSRAHAAVAELRRRHRGFRAT